MKSQLLIAAVFCIAACGKTPEATKSKPNGDAVSQTASVPSKKTTDTAVSPQPSPVKTTDPRQKLLQEELGFLY